MKTMMVPMPSYPPPVSGQPLYTPAVKGVVPDFREVLGLIHEIEQDCFPQAPPDFSSVYSLMKKTGYPQASSFASGTRPRPLPAIPVSTHYQTSPPSPAYSEDWNHSGRLVSDPFQSHRYSPFNADSEESFPPRDERRGNEATALSPQRPTRKLRWKLGRHILDNFRLPHRSQPQRPVSSL